MRCRQCRYMWGECECRFRSVPADGLNTKHVVNLRFVICYPVVIVV